MPPFAIWQFFHLFALLYWVGGLVFLGFYLLPRWSQLQPSPQAWQVLQKILAGFSLAGIFAALLLLISGYAMVFSMGGFAALGVDIWLMVILGTIAALGAFHLYFAAGKKLQRAIENQDVTAAQTAAAKYGRFARFLAVLSFVLTLIGVLGVYL